MLTSAVDAAGLRAHVLGLAARAHPRLTGALRDIAVMDDPGPSADTLPFGAIATADAQTGTVTFWGGVTRAAEITLLVVEHELAHLLAWDGGPPVELRTDWRAAAAADRRRRPRTVECVGLDGQRTGLLAGAAAVSAYAQLSGPAEDWADSVAFFLHDRRVLGRLGRVAGRGRVRSFAQLWPARASVLTDFLA